MGSLCGSARAAVPLVNAPQPTNTMGLTDWSLAGGLLAGRALDWASTEQCLRRPYCHEAELPNALVRSKVGLGAFEAGAAGISILLQRYEMRHGHRTLARTMAAFNSGLSLTVDAHNYRVAK